jgi:hypothetical protein
MAQAAAIKAPKYRATPLIRVRIEASMVTCQRQT